MGSPSQHTKPCSWQLVLRRIKDAVAAAGAEPSRSSGIPARKGGLSTATEAGVDENILSPQSGPGSVGVSASTRSLALIADFCGLRPVIGTVYFAWLSVDPESAAAVPA